MFRAKNGGWLFVLTAVALLCVGAAAYGTQMVETYVVGNTGAAILNNTTGTTVTGIHIEFDQAVTIGYKLEIGGTVLPALGPAAGTSFDFNGGSLVPGGSVLIEWQPASARPSLAMWMVGAQPVGAPYFTTVDQLGYLFGLGIVHLRETDPVALQAAFAEFFADNQAYFAQLSLMLGMSLQDSLLPIIMSAPAAGIQNFFGTIVGMLGVTDLGGLLGGDVDFSSLLTALGL